MTTLLLAVFIYTIVYGLDYLFYVKQPSTYQFVSRRTALLFLVGQLITVALFYSEFKPFIADYIVELPALLLLLVMALLFTWALTREKLLVCSITSRSERCLTPGYTIVKGLDIVFQQMIYAVVALSLVDLLGQHWYVYPLFTFIVVCIHTTIVLSCGKKAAETLILGVIMVSIPSLYIVTVLGVFWPAVYLHALLYVFYWLLIGDFEGKVVKVDN